MDGESFERRIYRPELAKLMGFSPEWIRRLERDGRLPASRRDVGGRRVFWLASEVAQIVAGKPVAAPEKQQVAAA